MRMPHGWTTESLPHFVAEPKHIVFDVRGERGFETKQLSRMIGPKGRVVVLEFLPPHITRLEPIGAR